MNKQGYVVNTKRFLSGRSHQSSNRFLNTNDSFWSIIKTPNEKEEGCFFRLGELTDSEKIQGALWLFCRLSIHMYV